MPPCMSPFTFEDSQLIVVAVESDQQQHHMKVIIVGQTSQPNLSKKGSFVYILLNKTGGKRKANKCLIY